MINLDAILAEVRTNKATLDACRQHRFHWPEAFERRLGQKLLCSNCGGMMDAIWARHYVLGWIAAGRDPNEVMPGWSGTPASVGTEVKKSDETS